ncbi:Uncharacterised protein [uncultured archaeon]|nr:Uncharacterised protein [uncultured archaeon]
MHSFNLKGTAQGTIEYLVVLAVIVIISLIVVGLVGSNTNPQSIATTSGKIGNLTQGGLSIADAIVAMDGNGLLNLQNNSGDMLTVNKISLDGVDNNYNQQLASGSELLFSLTNLQNACSCTIENINTVKTCTAIIYYTTQDGLQKSTSYSLTVDCVDKSVAVNQTEIVLPSDNNPPAVRLYSPQDNYPANGKVSFIFSASDNNAIKQCFLNLDGSDVNSISSIDANTQVLLDYNVALLSPGTHQWDIRCIDFSNNATSTSSRSINYFQCNNRTAGGYFFSGSGSTGSPYTICDCQMLQDVNNSPSSNYSLISGIDCSATISWNEGVGFSPLPLTGSFDGNNKIISYIYILRPSTDGVGLFTSVSSTVKNLGLTNINITGNWRVGGIAGDNGGTIKDSYTTGQVFDGYEVGGISGRNYGTILNSYSAVNFLGGATVGGLSGVNRATIQNSFATGDVLASGTYDGSLVGDNEGTIRNTFSTGTVTGSHYYGNPVGVNFGSITNSPTGSSSTFYSKSNEPLN